MDWHLKTILFQNKSDGNTCTSLRPQKPAERLLAIVRLYLLGIGTCTDKSDKCLHVRPAIKSHTMPIGAVPLVPPLSRLLKLSFYQVGIEDHPIL
jgi:hypothetical protein